MLSFNWANFKKIYNVKEVNIYGTTFFDQSIIQEKSNAMISYNIFNSELRKHKNEILNFDHIIDCKISRNFPSTIDITIYEREPVALISSDELIILDSNGVCLPVEYCDLSLPILTNFKSNPELYPKGLTTASTNVLNSVVLMKYTKDNFSMIYDEISEFVFNEDSEYEIILKNGKTRIILGGNKLQDKIKYLNSFQETLKDEKNIKDFKYIDLRFDKQIIVKEV
jgi:cell division septal protein FtsQ